MDSNLIKVVNYSKNPLPEYATEGSSGLDLRAYLLVPHTEGELKHKGFNFETVVKQDNMNVEIILEPNGWVLIPTGIHLDLPFGIEAQVRPRSGLALHYGITVLNAPGSIDSDYKGDVGVILKNTSDTFFNIKNGDRIAQLVFSTTKKVVLKEIDKSLYGTSERGEDGFGSTGKG